MEGSHVTDLSLLNLFRQCSHLQFHRISRFQGQGRILVLLEEHGKLTQRQLTHLTQRRSATLSEQLEAMERDGLITRVKNSEDKRNVDICLTQQGKEIAREAKQEREETATLLFGGLDEKEKDELFALLQTLHSQWSKTENEEKKEKGDKA